MAACCVHAVSALFAPLPDLRLYRLHPCVRSTSSLKRVFRAWPAAMRPPSTLPATPPVFPLFRLARALTHPQYASQRQLRCAASGTAVAEAPAAAVAATPSAQQLLPASWPGLHAWRAAEMDVRTVWGTKGPVPATAAAAAELGSGAVAVAAAERAAEAGPLPASLAECARAVLLTADPLGKAALTHRAWRAWCDGRLPLGTGKAATCVAPHEVQRMHRRPRLCQVLAGLGLALA